MDRKMLIGIIAVTIAAALVWGISVFCAGKALVALIGGGYNLTAAIAAVVLNPLANLALWRVEAILKDAGLL